MTIILPSQQTTVKLKENKWRDTYQDLARELINTMECEVDTTYNWYLQYNPEMIGKGNRKLGNKKTNEDYRDKSNIKIGLNTGKSPGDLRKFAFSQTLVKDHQLMLTYQNFKEIK